MLQKPFHNTNMKYAKIKSSNGFLAFYLRLFFVLKVITHQLLPKKSYYAPKKNRACFAYSLFHQICLYRSSSTIVLNNFIILHLGRIYIAKATFKKNNVIYLPLS